MCPFSFVPKRKNQKYCSINCAASVAGRKGGRISAAMQSVSKRSKNEIHFAELCSVQFSTVLTNKSIFNGWDADVIIEDLKIAVLWNGRWHYDKITQQHSVKQVQTRDSIKLKEIVSAGYIPYIVKDMGKMNKIFVRKEFQKFLQFIQVHKCEL